MVGNATHPKCATTLFLNHLRISISVLLHFNVILSNLDSFRPLYLLLQKLLFYACHQKIVGRSTKSSSTRSALRPQMLLWDEPTMHYFCTVPRFCLSIAIFWHTCWRIYMEIILISYRFEPLSFSCSLLCSWNICVKTCRHFGITCAFHACQDTCTIIAFYAIIYLTRITFYCSHLRTTSIRRISMQDFWNSTNVLPPAEPRLKHLLQSEKSVWC